MPPTLEQISVTDLHFDPANPRLPERVNGADPAEVTDFFLLECNLIELMMSIAEQGYFHGEPLLAVPASEGAGYTVVEGNRRLASLMLLSGQIEPRSMEKAVSRVLAEAKEKPLSVPCLVFPNREDVLNYLGYRHITGIKEWDALAKARYLFQLRDRIGGTDHSAAHRTLAKEIGSKSNAVAKTLTGFNILNYAKDAGILRELGLSVDEIPFSLLTTAIGWQNIAEFIGLTDPGDVELTGIDRDQVYELFLWAFYKSDGYRTKIGDSRNFSKFSRIVTYPQALSALRNGASLEEADVLAEGPVEAIRILIQKAISSIEHAQRSIALAGGLTEDDLADSTKLRKLAASLEGSIRSNLVIDED
ncbi:hypothetical protein [Croceicoccus marinus]|uniref:ParB/Sulfiredoxin domain-containing protein n=1 Tax=Croceicoccus marinus TaxID=450378 RepID=A0A7G6VW77_9SPHN|nr:hypothetical protein [Croceicoccus marinus]QNE05992.1 hypothetical protein H4O24_04930 [Croceicoccus marinus]